MVISDKKDWGGQLFLWHVINIFSCFKVEWLKNDEPLSSEGVTKKGGDYNLIISAVQLSHSGNYTCVASNIVAKRRSATATVVVYGKISNSWYTSCLRNCPKGFFLLHDNRILHVCSNDHQNNVKQLLFSASSHSFSLLQLADSLAP